jgi:transcriptional antiterminator RfaH
MNQWHLVYTKPRQEEKAFINLKNQNYESYLPFILKEKILKGKKVLMKEPMFSRYLFIRLNNDGLQNWSPIRSTKGVSHLVNFGSHLATLDDEIINILRQKIGKNLTIKAFSDNDSVEIIDGPFKGLKALFKAYSGDERAILLLDFMAKHIHAKFNLKQFKKVA